MPFPGFEDADTTDVLPDFFVVAPRADAPDRAWLIAGDAKDYEREFGSSGGAAFMAARMRRTTRWHGGEQVAVRSSVYPRPNAQLLVRRRPNTPLWPGRS